MVLILPKVPSFGEQFAERLGSSFTKGFDVAQKNKQENELLEKKFNFQQQLKNQENAQKTYNEQLKTQQVQQQKEEEKGKFRSQLERLKSLKPYAGSTRIPFTKSYNPHPILNPEAMEARAEIKATGVQLADYVYNNLLGNKGPITEAKINELMKSYIISEDDPEAIYQGKLNNLERLFELTLSGLNADEAFRELNGEAPKQAKNKESVVRLYKDGEAYNIPKDKVKSAVKQGYRQKK